jgi:surface antigen
MKIERLTRVSLLTLMLWLPASALAGNYSFLRHDPVAYFNKEDWRIADQAYRKALDENPDGATTSWENPKSGVSGTITPIRTYRGKDGQTCRKVRSVDRTRVPKRQNQWTLDICQDGEGKWVFDTPRRHVPAAAPAEEARPAGPAALE